MKKKKQNSPTQALMDLQEWQKKNSLQVELSEIIPMISILMMSVAELTAKASELERKYRDVMTTVQDRVGGMMDARIDYALACGKHRAKVRHKKTKNKKVRR